MASASVDLSREVVFRRAALQLNLRDVRVVFGGGGIRNAVYHVPSYLGRTDVPVEGFAPPRDEIAGLRYASPSEVGALLVRALAAAREVLYQRQRRAATQTAGPAGPSRRSLMRLEPQ